ncbi:MAG: LysR family transcriptional regulator substrate-binding protein, partial [Pseudomonadota bacterium]
IEDFDSDIIPEIAVYLSQIMSGCHFTYSTDSSHTIIEMLRNRHLDLGIASAPHEHFRDLQDRPILRDPFVVVLPRVAQRPMSEIVEGQGDLPFLRFSSELLIARQIESQMRRLGFKSTSSFECSNNQTLMAMVAAGAGWTITTPLLYARAKRFQSKLTMHKFPGKSFSRTLSIITTPDCSRSMLDLIDAKLRTLISQYAISRLTRDNPWLADSFQLIG